MPPRRRGIVIDASIAQAAGRREHPTSSRSRVFLEELRRICHGFTVTDTLMAEWKTHASSLAREWLASMWARRKVYRLAIVADDELTTEVGDSTRHEKDRDGMLKDLHLIQAALGANSPVASMDEAARRSFRRAAQTVRRLRAVVWVNPTLDADDCVPWLENGAPDEDRRRIGYGAAQ